MKKIYFLIISVFLFTAMNLTAQTVFEPIHSSVYEFLDRMAQKGVIEFNDVIIPVSRLYIAQKLMELKENYSGKLKKEDGSQASPGNLFTELEREELEFYLKDYGIELQKISGDKIEKPKDEIENSEVHPVTGKDSVAAGKQSITTLVRNDPYGRFRLFAYEDSLFKVDISPILGYQFGTRDGAKYSHSWNGLYLYGYLTDKLGFDLRFWDNSENGTTIDKTKNFTPVTGITVAKSDVNNIQYSEVTANIATNWSWGEFSVGKDFIEWGYGESGKLVLSGKAPSFPFIRLDIHPVKWLKFNYIHAWLSSDLLDSNSIYATYRSGLFKDQFKPKFLASHTLSIYPANGLDISLGESIIYSDKIEIPYLIPIMFFRLADHYLSQNNNSVGGNAQFFLGVSSRNEIKNTHLYGTLFIDELTLEGLFNSATQRNQFGFTLGGSITDLPIDNITITTEFTKIYPFVYAHYIPTLTYQSSGYVMGHWMGNDADLIYGSINYKFIRGLQATLWAQYIRKGSVGTPDEQYSQPQPPFLFGLRTNYSYFGFDIKYEITHELFARIQYQTTKTSAQQLNLNYTDSTLKEFYLSLYYGM